MLPLKKAGPEYFDTFTVYIYGQGTSVDWVYASVHHSMIHSLNLLVLWWLVYGIGD